MPLMPIALRDAQMEFDPHWLAPAESAALYDQLRATIRWETHRIRLFGREVDSPRLSCWIGDADASYRYSGVRFEPHPWTDALLALRARLETACGARFNSVLANLYRDGRDRMGWHSDDEPELGAAPVIASLSLGARRRFALKHKRDPALRFELPLDPGSLLLMRGSTQREWKHALPAMRRVEAARINLTFRHVDPSRAPRRGAKHGPNRT
jgi:alkylated DNA repair dioxygenase AlkB